VAVESLLRVADVTRRFGSTVALERTSFELAEGTFTSVVGPSGCGKSTLFNVVSGLLAPDDGRVYLDDHDVTGRTGLVGYMLQKDLLVPWRTVVNNITLGAKLTGRITEADRHEARRLARQYGLGEFLDHYPSALSGGMRQRVALMRTLVTNHRLLLLDEPFGALDSQTRLEMQQWLLRVWSESGRTVLFITHDVDEAVFLSDRVLVMSPRPGRVAADLEVTLARPRELATLTTTDFTDVKRQILELLHGGLA
jgi:ABC-type nitrate/sulfonate/bicarbonate transport system ATPase subunit